MNKIEIAIVTEFTLLTLYVVFHVLISRFAQPAKRWGIMKTLFFPFVLSAFFLGFKFNAKAFDESTAAWGIFAGLILIWLVHIGYLTVYAVFDRSITLRTLIEMRDADQPLTFEAIQTRYSPHEAFDRRLEILLENDFLVKKSDHYFLTEKGQRTGKLIGFLKDLYRTGEGG